MKMSVSKTFRFDAAHYLPKYEGKCKNLHGHGWTLEVEVSGGVDPSDGFVVDFAKLKKCVNEVVDLLDHTCLNDTQLGFAENPTCENILTWLWERLEHTLRGYVRPGRRLVRLRLYETPDSFAELTNYFGEKEL